LNQNGGVVAAQPHCPTTTPLILHHYSYCTTAETVDADGNDVYVLSEVVGLFLPKKMAPYHHYLPSGNGVGVRKDDWD
jgi:hypothetical protein